MATLRTILALGGVIMSLHDEVEALKDKIADLGEELREHGERSPDPKCAALCETSAEVLGGLETAFEHFLEKNEEAWRNA